MTLTTQQESTLELDSYSYQSKKQWNAKENHPLIHALVSVTPDHKNNSIQLTEALIGVQTHIVT